MRSWPSRAAAAAMLIAVPMVAVEATSFASLLSSSERPDADKARDADRKPVVIMAFAGVRPGLKVAELAPGGGYFTRLLTLPWGRMAISSPALRAPIPLLQHGPVLTPMSRLPA